MAANVSQYHARRRPGQARSRILPGSGRPARRGPSPRTSDPRPPTPARLSTALPGPRGGRPGRGVEAAGIEPASRDTPTCASTCVGRRCVSPASSRRPGNPRASPAGVSSRPCRAGVRDQPATCRDRPPQARDQPRGYSIRQPERSAGWHFSVSGCFTRPPGVLGTPLHAVTASGRCRSPPRSGRAGRREVQGEPSKGEPGSGVRGDGPPDGQAVPTREESDSELAQGGVVRDTETRSQP